jgi:polysaccharide biosynthesis transport protein
VISGSAGLAGRLREALTAAVDSPPEQLDVLQRSPTDPLHQPPLDPDFVERCRLALARLVAYEDEGVVAVCSARRGDGRSSVAAALALTLARSRAEGRVLLLDLDFGHATQAALMSVAPSPGLADFLEGRERLRLAAGGPSRQLWLAPSGTYLGDRLRLFHALTGEAMLPVFREKFQWVVLDLPPVLGHPETTALVRSADWQMVVGRHRRTTLADLREAAEVVGGDKPRGFLLTADSTRIPGWLRRLL